jgi:hypothetical protein
MIFVWANFADLISSQLRSIPNNIVIRGGCVAGGKAGGRYRAGDQLVSCALQAPSIDSRTRTVVAVTATA